MDTILAGVTEGSGGVAETADRVADALTRAGYATTTTPVDGPIHGVQICQHHCPVSHVAEEFPELCETESEAFAEILGTHVQRLATIANGDCACTTHVPLDVDDVKNKSNTDTESKVRGTARTRTTTVTSQTASKQGAAT